MGRKLALTGHLSESVVEGATFDWFAELGYTVAHAPDLAPEGDAPELYTVYANALCVKLLPKLLSGETRITGELFEEHRP